ncbi:MAG: TRAP transporter TatT component family protein [Gammaproteobacteria bacterium]|nr:TRAP transporter TatT component family protein [Gammaproteobacteria bacterium]MDH3751966.1 TRAP transporter TatT component family protein [Gammaproteobacteria bacterium]
MRPILQESRFATLLVLLAVTTVSGCASLISNAASGLADDLSSAILNQDDPETVRAGMPSYMLLMDSFVEGNPDDPAMLGAAANLYASYGAIFADDDARASRLTARARDYALRGICASYAAACDWREMNYEDFVGTLDGLTERHAEAVYSYSFATLAYLQAHSSDWNARAELPQAEALVKRYLEIAGDSSESAAHMYLGIILTILPPALGGKPEEARIHFEKAITASAGRDLSAKIEFAKGYAKKLYERELHDQLVNEVLEASPYADGLTLTNVLAQEEALRLRAEADDYF